MELNLFILAPLLQCTFKNRYALFMRAKKKNYFILLVIKIIPLAHFFFHSFICASLSLIHSYLNSLSQLRSLNSLSQLPPKLDITNPPAVPSRRSALDPCRRSPQTHFSFVFSLSLSLSLSVFSFDWVPHYPTHLKSEHSVSLCTHHHCL